MLKLGKAKTDYPDRKSTTFYAGCCCGACCCCCCSFWVGGVVGTGLGLLYAKGQWSEARQEEQNKKAVRSARKGFWFTLLVSVLVVAASIPIADSMSSSPLKDTIRILWVLFPVWNVLLAAIVSIAMAKRAAPGPELKTLIFKRNAVVFLTTLAGYALGWGILVIV